MAHTETTGAAPEPDGVSARAPQDGPRRAAPPRPAALPRTAAEARRLVSDLLTTRDGHPADGAPGGDHPYGAGGPGNGEHSYGAGDLRRGYAREDAGHHREAAERARTDALLAVSELVTNAIRHGGGLTGFTARLTPDGLLLHIEDADERPPVTRDPLAGPGIAVGGYGWPLVCRIAREVAVAPLPEGGKRITVLLPRS
ncbi:ATP-binding protein [Streptomyces sp. NPDC049954]|uniref:ATP-binding protein n=1 Tax=Streptomyces sp. NPDC049954 TaxID=3155779 RepID=UPI0034156F17